MATITKNFKIKSGLIVEGTTGTINNYDIITKNPADASYIIGLIGGSATALATADTVVLRDSAAGFAAGEITATSFVGALTGTASDISNHTTDSLSEGTGNLYFADYRATDAVAANLGTGIVYSAETAGNVFHIDENVVATRTYADGVASTAQTNAESSAQFYADNAENNAVATASTDATTKAAAAELSAKNFATAADTDLLGTVTTNIATAKTEAIDTASTDATSKAAAALVDAKAYTDQEVAALVDSAPALLDTLNELAAAIGDDASFATTIGTSIGEKLSKAGDTMSGALAMGNNNITGLGTPSAVDHATTKGYVDGEITSLDTLAQGYATSAQSAAESFATSADSTLHTTVTGEISTAISTEVTNRNAAISTAISTEVSDRNTAITTAVNALDTDAIEEGTTNKYFTDARAKSAVAGDISTAINALSTDDIEEGSSNLYFSNTLARSAVAEDIATAVADGDILATPVYLAVNIADIAKQIAATVDVATASTATAFSWSKTAFRSAELLVKVAYGTHTEISKVMLTLDSSDNIAITEYAVVGTNGSASTISAGINGTDVELQVTTVNNNSAVTVTGTLLV